jgi:phosphate transport system protein
MSDDLAAVKADVIRLGGLASEAIEAGTAAFLDADLAAVERVIAGDRALDDLMHAIEARTYLLLASRPARSAEPELRLLVTIPRVVHELERAGDLMVNVAKATRRLYPYVLEPRVRGIVDRMREQAGVQLRLAVDTFADGDLARAAALPDMDDVIDDLQKDLFRYIFASSVADEGAVQRAVQIALVGRYYERVGDHAANIAERVEFLVTGTLPDAVLS